MADSTRSGVIVRMPPTLKRRLAREASRGGGSMNDVALAILGDHFGVGVPQSGRRGNVPGAGGVVLLRMPSELKALIKREAARLATTTNDLIVRTLADRLGVRAGIDRKEVMATTAKHNGRARKADDKVRVAIIGVGNCANALLQCIEY